MEECVVCGIQTSKYKCPRCFSRYCSVPCCKAHKESCQHMVTTSIPDAPQTLSTSRMPNYPLFTACPSDAFSQDTSEGEDSVSEELLNKLKDNQKLCSTLSNPHLRAMMENLVNSDNPSLDMAKAMQEPIFVEFADECLKVVDTDNRNMEPEGSAAEAP